MCDAEGPETRVASTSQHSHRGESSCRMSEEVFSLQYCVRQEISRSLAMTGVRFDHYEIHHKEGDHDQATILPVADSLVSLRVPSGEPDSFHRCPGTDATMPRRGVTPTRTPNSRRRGPYTAGTSSTVPVGVPRRSMRSASTVERPGGLAGRLLGLAHARSAVSRLY